MEKRTIKITESQADGVINELPFSYLGNDTTDKNDNSEIHGNVPIDNADFEPEPVTADKVSHTLTNNSWWNRHYGFNGYSL